MCIAMDYDFSYLDKVAKCNSFQVMRQFINIFIQKWPPGGHFGSDETEITIVQFHIGELLAKISGFLVKYDDRVKTKMAADRQF